jgi:hypothetical protein
MAEGEGWQILERAEPYVAALAVAGNDVLTRVDADVPDVWAQPPQLGTPTAFPGTDVQYGSQLAAEEVFGRTDDHAHLSADRLGDMNPGSRIAVPLLEVGFIVRFATGVCRRLGGHHAVVQR